MYERNAIVLERYFEKIFGFAKDNNLKTNFENYKKIIETINEYKKTADEEESAIVKFDEIAEEIESIQKRQTKLHDLNIELESQRNKYFNDLSENPSTLDNKLKKIEDKLNNNNEELKELRSDYVEAIVFFTERQKERNKYARTRRTAETNYRNQINKSIKLFEEINKNEVKKIQEFLHTENDIIEKEIVETLSKNGKSERVPFFSKVLENAAKERTKIAKIEGNLYINIYEKTKKILNEIENETVKLGKAEKLSRDTEVKLAFLDNERMTAINGKKTHERLMEEACKNFEKDIEQIENLYELVLRETTNKSTKKAYKELYNKDYLRKIEEKEKDFEEEVTNVKVSVGTVINSNYWRIEGIKNIYKVFQEEISEKFNKDLSEFRIEEPEDIEQNRKININYEDEEENDEYYDDEYEDEDDNSKDEEGDYEDDEYYDDDDYEEDEEYDDYEDEEDDDYEEDSDEEDEYDDYEDEDDNEYEDDIEDEEIDDESEEKEEIILQEDEDLTEEKIDELIRNSRKKNKKKTTKKTNKKKESKDDNNSKGLFGKLFKK